MATEQCCRPLANGASQFYGATSLISGARVRCDWHGRTTVVLLEPQPITACAVHNFTAVNIGIEFLAITSCTAGCCLAVTIKAIY